MPARGIVEPYRFYDGAQIALDIEPFLQHGLDRLRPELETGDVAHHEIQSLEATGVARCSHQCARFLEGGAGIRLIANPFAELVRRRGEIREWVADTTAPHCGPVLDDTDHCRPAASQMPATAQPWTVE